ncbi:MAG: hypothetical protein ACYTAF_06090 [Planctomycetota bacterium]|jgi:hypothetical protein
MEMIIAGGICLLCCGFACGLIAEQKGRNPFYWFFAGLLLNVLGVAIVAAATDPKQEQRIEKNVSHMAFAQLTKAAETEESALCGGCGHFRSPDRFCRAFGLQLSLLTSECVHFYKAPSELEADDGAQV